MAILRVEKNKNYTVMSNYHLKDKNLSLKSKGLLSVILSLPEEWNYTTRGLASICKEGVDCIGATLRELESAGYIERNQLRDERGKITDTEYVIYEFPQSFPQNPQAKTPDTPMPHTATPCTEKPYMGESDTENPAQYNTNTNKIKKEKIPNGLNNHQSIKNAGKDFSRQPDENTADRIDEIDKFNRYREIIYENIEYNILCERYDREKVDEIVDTMLDYICGKRESVKIGKAEYPPEIVKSRLLKLDSSHIEYVIDCMKKTTTKIGNIRAYMLTALYNAPTTMDHYYTTLVNHDMANDQNKKGKSDFS